MNEVTGLAGFADFFRGYGDSFAILGGAACAQWLTISIMLLFAVGMIYTADVSKGRADVLGFIKPALGLALALIPLVVFIRRSISIRKTYEVKTAHATSAWAITCAIVGLIFWSIVCCQMVPNTAPVIVRSFQGYPYKDVGLTDQLFPIGVLFSFFAPILLVPYYAILTYLRIKNRRANLSVKV